MGRAGGHTGRTGNEGEILTGGGVYKGVILEALGMNGRIFLVGAIGGCHIGRTGKEGEILTDGGHRRVSY